MDPQQRLLLEVGYAGIHASGYRHAKLMGNEGGVFLGIERPDWLFMQPPSAQTSVYAATGDNASIAGGRLSFVLGLQGPCVSVDTACSSALVALDAAALFAQYADCTLAAVMSTSLKLSPHLTRIYASAGMLSSDGRCKTLDCSANGYVRSEAIGALVLDAHNHAVDTALLLSSANRQDGRSASLTAPNGTAQRVLLSLALNRGSLSPQAVTVIELHGTGTALGDPTEAGALAATHGSVTRSVALAAQGSKANVGHAEAAAGMVGWVNAYLSRQQCSIAGNVKLRRLNPLVCDRVGIFVDAVHLPLHSAKDEEARKRAGCVSSFGYSGTIAHAVLRRETESMHSPVDSSTRLVYHRRGFAWREPSHPFAQHHVHSQDRSAIFHSPSSGPLRALVADHVVHGRIIFPGAGYLEMARAAGAGALRDVYFLQPLAIQARALVIECKVADGRFEVRSGESAVLDDATVHCSGAVVEGTRWRHTDHGALRSESPRAAGVNAIYDSFHAAGLQYGPGYRTLATTWHSESDALARLRARSSREGTQVHPADLDDALCISCVVDPGASGETRLPFCVKHAQLQGAPGKLWASVSRQGGEAAVRLDTLAGQPSAQLDGFTVRALRAEAPIQRHLYMTEWQQIELVATESIAEVLTIGDDQAGARNILSSYASAEELARKLRMGGWAAIAALVSMQRGQTAVLPLFALEVALTLVKVQAETVGAPRVWLLTAGCAEHAGVWGLSRAARAEALLPLLSLHSPTAKIALPLAPALTEPEAFLHERISCVPRLAIATPRSAGYVRLQFHARGAISNLFVEPQPSLASIGDDAILLHVRAVGLNFRDVLNVLGEYPGDPGPPGADAAGVIDDSSSTAVAAFGISHAPLACLAIASALLVANKPEVLSFEGACTLPITWTTTHAALQRAELCASSHVIIHAAAGGVGLKAVEYTQWLNGSLLATAGRPHKHRQLLAIGVRALCTSRNGAGFVFGLMHELSSMRSHMVLNSLSLDFIAASFASLGQGGAFEEIGKRGVWASARCSASSPAVSYCAIAIDADMALDPSWMHASLTLAATRAQGGNVTALPWQSYDMEVQHQLAFRTLQSGLNVGKIVVRVRARSGGLRGVHIVSGGTGGLGLLTGRWLAHRGARSLVLASRSGRVALAHGMDEEWKSMHESGAVHMLQQCDTSETAHIRRLLAPFGAPCGIWHAAGVLADAVLAKQDAISLSIVYAPKACGAWGLHAAGAMSAVDIVGLFSSVAALLGGLGQTNYAAANSCLDALAESRRAHGLVANSVQWGAWAEIGMAARGTASVRMAAMEAATGFGRISLANGLSALGTSVQPGSPSVLACVPLVWSRFLKTDDAPAFLNAFVPRVRDVGDGPIPSTSASCRLVSLETVLEMVKRTAGGAVDADAALMEAGVDSLGAVELRNQLQSASVDQSLPSTLIFDHPTARQLAHVLQPKQPASTAVAATAIITSSRAAGSVASIGSMSALLPLGAYSTHMVDCMAACGSNAVVQVPAARWDVSRLQPMLREPIASRVRHAGFVLGAELADNAAFAISSAEMAAMDPCQRLVLEHGYKTLHGASMDRSGLCGSLAGVFLGFAGTEFGQVLSSTPAGGSVYAATGSSASIACGRLSYTLGLNGPCVSYDTACSASLSAAHGGLRALQLAECTAGIVAGVTIMLTPAIGASFAVAGMTSARGRSHTFDARADGYARGEACGAVTLFDQSGVAAFAGSAVRQDGRSASLTAPNGQAQQGLLTAALQDANTAADALTLIEAHGTGTALGDPIEMGSLGAAVLRLRCEDGLGVSSAKASVGHAEPAAGMVGLVKLTIGIGVCRSAPNAQLRSLNPHVSGALHGSKLCALPVQLASTLGLEGVCAGGVSSFGYAGTIAHAVLRYASGNQATSIALPPLVYRRRAFPWREVRATSYIEVTSLYSTCWATFNDVAGGTVDMDSAIADMGLDSLSSMELLSRLQHFAPSADLELSQLLAMNTVTPNQVVDFLKQHAAEPIPQWIECSIPSEPLTRHAAGKTETASEHWSLESIPKFRPLEPTSTGVIRGPLRTQLLFYIPGMPGLCLQEFQHLCLLPFTVVGLPYARDARRGSSLSNLVDSLLERILDLHFHDKGSPIRLMGHSFGTLLATLVSRRLEQTGNIVSALIMVDPPRVNIASRAFVAVPKSSAIRHFVNQLQAVGLKFSFEDVLDSFENQVSMFENLDELLLDDRSAAVSAPTLVLHAVDSQGGAELFESLLPCDSVMIERWNISKDQQLLLAAARDVRNEWRMEQRWFEHVYEVVVQGGHLSCLTSSAYAGRLLEPVAGFLNALDDDDSPAVNLGTSFMHDEAKYDLCADAVCLAWYVHDVQWRNVPLEFAWADDPDEAMAIWVVACSVPPMKKEVQWSLLAIDTILLQQQQSGTHRKCLPPLSAYRSYRTGSKQEPHQEQWIFFALLKALSGEDITAVEVSRHFRLSFAARAASVRFSQPCLSCSRLAGCYELSSVDIMGVGVVKQPALSGRLLYVAEGIMAASVKLHVSGMPNTSVSYSGEWKEMGDDVGTHVLHWSRCNLHAATVDSTVDSSHKPGNYFATRARSLSWSADECNLTLRAADGIALHWRRAPDCGWHYLEGQAVSEGDLCHALLKNMDRIPGQTYAQHMFKASLIMQALIGGFVEPVDKS